MNKITTKDFTNWVTPVKTTFTQNRGIQVLSGVLVLQLVAATGLMWQRNAAGEFAVPGSSLASFDPAAVTQMRIDDADQSITLTLTDGQWLMDNEFSTVADSDKVDTLLSSIQGLEPGLSIAGTEGSHAQLQVAADNYQRRVVLNSDTETVADLYLGTSPGFRKSHARQADNDAVYAVKLNTFDVPAEKDDWLDTSLLALNEPTQISADDTVLALTDDQWSLVEPQEKTTTHEVDSTAIDSLVNTLASLQVTGFAEPLELEVSVQSSDTSTSQDDDATTDAPQLLTHQLTVMQGDTPVTITISRLEDAATIERSDVKGLFGLPVTSFEALTPEAVQQVLVAQDSEDDTEASVISNEQPDG